MLIPAILRKNEILTEYQKLQYSEKMMYASGCCDNWSPIIAEEPNKETYQYAIVDAEDKLIGYISFFIDWYNSQANRFGLISFDPGNILIGKEVSNILNQLLYEYKIHRIEWSVVGGNPVEDAYERFCNKHCGKKFIYTDVFKDRYGKYHDSIVYEIINQDIVYGNGDCI